LVSDPVGETYQAGLITVLLVVVVVVVDEVRDDRAILGANTAAVDVAGSEVVIAKRVASRDAEARWLLVVRIEARSLK